MAAEASSVKAETLPPEGQPAEPGVLAFATDPESEQALREGLAGYRDAQVWPGGLRAALSALGSGAGTRLLFVDLGRDRVPGRVRSTSSPQCAKWAPWWWPSDRTTARASAGRCCSRG